MYSIDATQTVNITVAGTAPYSVSITLMPGYNWFGYTGTQPKAIATALVGLTPAPGDKITAKDGKEAEYHGDTETWEGTLETLVPGQGYVYHSNGTQSQTITLE